MTTDAADVLVAAREEAREHSWAHPRERQRVASLFLELVPEDDVGEAKAHLGRWAVSTLAQAGLGTRRRGALAAGAGAGSADGRNGIAECFLLGAQRRARGGGASAKASAPTAVLRHSSGPSRK